MNHPSSRPFSPPPAVHPNQYHAERLVVRWLDRSGDPYTLGYSGAKWNPPVRVGEKLYVVAGAKSAVTKGERLNLYRSKLPTPQHDWDSWTDDMLLIVGREPTGEWGVAHWYELAYIRHRVKRIIRDPALGGIMSNGSTLNHIAPTVWGEWHECPITEGTVGVEIREHGDLLEMGFRGYERTANEIVRLQTHRNELRELPTKHYRSEDIDDLRPKSAVIPGRPPINDWMWDAMVLQVGAHLQSDDPKSVRLFNEFMRKKVDAEMLTKFVRPTMPSRRLRRLGRYRRKRGIEPTDKKPLVTASLAIFGNLFWGTKHGYHREFVKEKGRKKGVMGVMSIIWVNTLRDMTHQYEYFNFEFEEYYRIFTTVINLIEKNGEQGNMLNMYVTPSEWEQNNCYTGPVENRVYVPLGFDGEIIAKLKDGISPFGEYWNMSTETTNRRIADILTAPQKQISAEEVRASYITNSPVCPEHNREIENKKLRGRCPDGRGHVPPMVRRTGDANVGFHLKAERDDDPGGLIGKLMRTHPIAVMDRSKEPMAVAVLTELEKRRSHEKRGTTIFMTSMESIIKFLDAWPYLKMLDEWSDIIVIDLGNRDWNMLFRYEPDLLRKPKWACTECKSTQQYQISDWTGHQGKYPPTHCGKPMKPVGKPIINYIYVGSDVENIPYYVLKAMKGKLDDLPDID